MNEYGLVTCRMIMDSVPILFQVMVVGLSMTPMMIELGLRFGLYSMVLNLDLLETWLGSYSIKASLDRHRLVFVSLGWH